METIEVLNRRLEERYGKYLDGRPLFRIVFSDDQFEKRWVEYSKGVQLLNKRIEEKPKYRQYIPHKYIIERLTVIPEFVETDLIENTTYECLWVFEDVQGNPLPPKWEVCEIVIDQVHKASVRAVGGKIDEDTLMESLSLKDPNLPPEIKQARLNQLVQDMFGNETDVTDALAHKSGIVVPGPQN
jgi:hypothetical protein